MKRTIEYTPLKKETTENERKMSRLSIDEQPTLFQSNGVVVGRIHSGSVEILLEASALTCITVSQALLPDDLVPGDEVLVDYLLLGPTKVRNTYIYIQL